MPRGVIISTPVMVDDLSEKMFMKKILVPLTIVIRQSSYEFRFDELYKAAFWLKVADYHY